MPIIYSEVEVEVELDVEDFLDNCLSSELIKLKKLLYIDISDYNLVELEQEKNVKDFVFTLCNSNLNIDINLFTEELNKYKGN